MKPLQIVRTGHSQIDLEHESLIDSLKRMESYIGQGYELSAQLNTLDFLVGYANKHFSNEEKLMAEVGYQKLSEHKFRHSELSAEISTLWSAVVSEGDLGSRLQSVSSALVAHINTDDADFVPYLKPNSIQPMKSN